MAKNKSKKTTKTKKISKKTIRRNDHIRFSLALYLLGVLILSLGTLAAITLIKQSTELRRKAAVGDTVTMRIVPESQNINPGEQTSFSLQLKTEIGIIGTEFVAQLSGALANDFYIEKFEPIAKSSVIVNLNTDDPNNYLFTAGLLTYPDVDPNTGNPIYTYVNTNNEWITIATLSYTAPASGQMDILIDTSKLTYSTEIDVTYPQEPLPPPSYTYTFQQSSVQPDCETETSGRCMAACNEGEEEINAICGANLICCIESSVEASPSPSPSPSTTPDTSPSPSPSPDASPSPTGSPGLTPTTQTIDSLHIIGRFYGVNQGRGPITALVNFGRGQGVNYELLHQQTSVFTYLSGNQYHTTLSLQNKQLPLGDNYWVEVKGEKHAQRAYQNLQINSKNFELNAVATPFLPGDVPPGSQNGAIDDHDALIVVTAISLSNQTLNILNEADLNYDGIVNTIDASLLNYSRRQAR